MPENYDLNENTGNWSPADTEIRDLIGHPPGWLLHSGISMVAIVTTILLIGSVYFKYPDKLVGSGKLTSKNPPIEIVSRTNGYIDNILFKEGNIVQKGDVIIQVNNTTDPEQLNELNAWIAKYNGINDPRDYLDLNFITNLQLGIIQDEYANLQLKYNEFTQTLQDGMVFQKIDNLSQEIEKIRALNVSKQKEISYFFEELELARKDLERNKNLNRDGVVSNVQLEKVTASCLQKERQFQGMNNTLIQNSIRIEQLELEKMNLAEERSLVIKTYQFKIAEILSRIQASIEKWSRTYKIEAPINGRMTFSRDITEQKNISKGEIIGHILPIRHNGTFVSGIFPSMNIGKVEKGQQVVLKFDAYPYKEYGVVNSKVDNISKIPIEDNKGILHYEVRMLLEDTIRTDYHKIISYKPNLTVSVEVITESRSLFDRLFDQFMSILKDQ